MAVPTIITPAPPHVQAWMDAKQREWLQRDVRASYERSVKRGALRTMIPLDAARRLLEMAGV